MAGVPAIVEAVFEGVLVRVDVPPPIAANTLTPRPRMEEVIHAHCYLPSARDSALVVIVVIPVVLRVPAMLVFIPPAMAGVPAVLPRCV
jgi:hypothetical protein